MMVYRRRSVGYGQVLSRQRKSLTVAKLGSSQRGVDDGEGSVLREVWMMEKEVF